MPVDKKIIQRFTEGDAEAFDAIYRQYSEKIALFTLGLVKDQEITKDLVQEVFTGLWEKRDQVNVNLNFDNYIFTIVYNAVRKFFRKKSIEKRVVNDLLNESPELFESADGPAIFNELFEIATIAVESLPPKRKAVYKLSRQEGMKIKEIASELSISPRTAENHLAKALRYLKNELAGKSFFMLLFFHLFIK